MPRQRMVKPDFFDSGSLAECTHTARLLFIGLWVMGDDKGNNKLSIRKLKRQIFPFDDLSDEDFVDAMAQLERVGCIKVYEVDGDEYITVPNFNVYQTVKNPSKTNIPEPPESLGKKKRTCRFYGSANPALTHDYPPTNPQGDNKGIEAGQDYGSGGTNPVLTPYEPPTGSQLNKERNKEEEFFPKEKNSSPSASSGAGADEPAPRTGGWVCPSCGSRAYVEPDGWRCPRHGHLDAADPAPELEASECPASVMEAVMAARAS